MRRPGALSFTGIGQTSDNEQTMTDAENELLETEAIEENELLETETIEEYELLETESVTYDETEAIDQASDKEQTMTDAQIELLNAMHHAIFGPPYSPEELSRR